MISDTLPYLGTLKGHPEMDTLIFYNIHLNILTNSKLYYNYIINVANTNKYYRKHLA